MHIITAVLRAAILAHLKNVSKIHRTLLMPCHKVRSFLRYFYQSPAEIRIFRSYPSFLVLKLLF